MLNIFKNRPTDVKGIRHALLQFIKEQLQKNEGGEGGIIKALHLFICCTSEERHLYEAAVYAGEANRFKADEIQKIADDFAIDLPLDWQLEISYPEAIPAGSIKAPNIDVVLQIITNRSQASNISLTAFIKVLNGDTDFSVYKINAGPGKINIGREEKVQTSDGFFRKNLVVFNGNTSSTANRSVSRQHAHIEWDAVRGAFYLYADEGGIPPHNKMKVRSEGGEPFKIQTTAVGYQLKEGDQIILGESAVLEFSLIETG